MVKRQSCGFPWTSCVDRAGVSDLGHLLGSGTKFSGSLSSSCQTPGDRICSGTQFSGSLDVVTDRISDVWSFSVGSRPNRSGAQFSDSLSVGVQDTERRAQLVTLQVIDLGFASPKLLQKLVG